MYIHLQKIKIQQEMQSNNDLSLDADADTEELIDQDYEDFYQSVHNQKEQDLDMQKEGDD